jgi:FAD/FMN-containing dehydrogenase
VFHAGDGNLHPLICFDSRFADQVRRVKEAGRELMEVCVAAGGTITGEHGVGLDKRELLPLVFSEADMNAMLSVRAAFDPLGLCNPGKIIPMLRGCGEARAVSIKDDLVSPPTRLQSPPPTPDSIEELSEIVKRAAAERLTITPAGGRTLLNRDPATNLIVDMSRFNKIIEHEPADLIAIAQAGVPLTTFNQKLSESGQWLPLDPPDNGHATLGGVVATGLGGPQQFGYGRPRGSVIGMTVVLADGSIIKAGGRVVKNVAGYDLCKLFTGSYGTLGIIAELIFKLRPRPAREATVVANGSIAQLLAAARAVLDARLFPVAVELLSSSLANRIGIEVDTAALLIRFAGNEKSVTYQIEQALLHLKNASIQETGVVSDDSWIWQNVAAVPVQEAPSFETRVLPTKVAGSINSIRSDVLWQAGVADGRLRLRTPLGHTSRDPLSQRIKQQLDPFNLLRGHDHEHAA